MSQDSDIGSRALEGRVCVVSGAGRGIGRLVARFLARHRAAVALCARSGDELVSVARDLTEEYGATVLAQPLDVTDVAAVRAFAARVASELGPAYGLINNAAIFGPVGRIDEVDLDAWRRALDVDVFGVANLTAAFVPAMVAAGAGSIVNLSGGGIGGPGVPPRASAYTSSKAAVAVLTETVAGELAGTGVRVNAVAPGNTPTGFLHEVLAVGPERAGPALFETARSQGAEDPEPVGLEAMVLFLLSDDADWVTGRLLSARRDSIDALVARRAVVERSSLFRLRRIDADLYREASEAEQHP